MPTATQRARLRPHDADRAAQDGSLLEIGVLDMTGDDPVVIHAMRLRPKFYQFINQG
jgi:hypothetical protein